MSALTLRLPDCKHERLRALAQSRGTSVNRVLDEVTTLLLEEFDAEARFLLRTQRGAGKIKHGLDLLDKAAKSLPRWGTLNKSFDRLRTNGKWLISFVVNPSISLRKDLSNRTTNQLVQCSLCSLRIRRVHYALWVLAGAAGKYGYSCLFRVEYSPCICIPVHQSTVP